MGHHNVLIIEDESSIRGFIKINLKRNNFNVMEAETGEEGINIVHSNEIDIVVLDIMLPGMDGFEVCGILRKNFPNIGIIMLTAKTQDIDKIKGLEYGADDYMIKPFNPLELVLRIKSLIRRSKRNLIYDDSSIIQDGVFKMDIDAKKLYKNGTDIELTPTEYSLMKLFLQNPGKAFKRDDILNMVWGYDFVGDSKIVDVNVRRLRSKIEDDSKNPKFIETIWGIGYRWRNRENA